MKRMWILLLLLVVCQWIAGQNLLLKNGRIWTFDRGVLEDTDLLVLEGRIHRIGKNLKAPGGEPTVVDLKGWSVIPGIIDSHNHIGLLGGINEFGENITPEVRMEYQIHPDDPNIYYSLTGGVTMAHNMHGSANPIGGQNVTMKLKWGRSIEEMREDRATRTLKMALGENPKRTGSSFPNTRMGVSAAVEEALCEALQYRERWREYRRKWKNTPRRRRDALVPPRRDLRLEALVEFLERKMTARIHSYRAEETLELIRLSEKYGFRIAAFEHIHQAYRIADELKDHGIGISVFADSWNYKTEASEWTPYGFRILFEKGVLISLNSDSSERMRRLYIDAGKMRRYAGMNDLEALKTITLNSAVLLGMDRYTGSITAGKDGDLAVFDGHPLSAMSKCMLTIIEGAIYFDRSRDPHLGPRTEKGGEE